MQRLQGWQHPAESALLLLPAPHRDFTPLHLYEQQTLLQVRRLGWRPRADEGGQCS